MNILLGSNHLHELGGSEQHLYTLAKEFKRQGHKVYVMLGNFTLKGSMSYILKKHLDIVVDEIPQNTYFDRVFLSHTSTVKRFKEEVYTRSDLKFNSDKIFQICHGVFPQLEQPFDWEILKYIAISNEVKQHIQSIKNNAYIVVLHNPIDTNYFYKSSCNSAIKRVYSLSQNDTFNDLIKEICKERNYEFSSNNKHTNPTLDIRRKIDDADLIFSLGRGCFEAMSMGKNVIVADDRGYMSKSYMDGLVTSHNFSDFLNNNCSGRFSKINPTKENLILEIEKYSSSNGVQNRKVLKVFCDSKKICNKFILA